MIDNGVGEWPEELVDSELMEAYRWSWPDLQATPEYVKRYCLQIQLMKNAKREQMAKSSRGPDAGMAPGGP